MAAAISYLVGGSAILALVITFQVKNVPPVVVEVLKYYLKVLPALFLANSLLGMGFLLAHKILKNLPLVAAMQSVAYYLFLLVFALLILGDKISIPRTLLGFALLGLGIFILKG
mgnify:CR=1 FL=1